MTDQETYDRYVQAAITGILANKNTMPCHLVMEPKDRHEKDTSVTVSQILKDAHKIAKQAMHTREEAFHDASPPSTAKVKKV